MAACDVTDPSPPSHSLLPACLPCPQTKSVYVPLPQSKEQRRWVIM